MLFAEGIANQINVKLAGGWSPIGETHNARFYMQLADVVDLYLKDRKEEVRHATYVSYSSTCSILKEWVNNNLYGCQIIDFNRVHAPIGLTIKAVTPEEIAISIAGELILVRAELS